MKKSLLLALSLIFLTTSSTFAGLIVGTSDGANGFPFGYNEIGWNPYQQVYDASAFSGPIDIYSLTFYDTVINNSADYGIPNNGIYSFQLSTTNAVVNGLSTNYLENLGDDNTEIFYGTIDTPSSFGDGFDVVLDKTFLYDPTMGNLLLTVTGSGITPYDGVAYDRSDDHGTMSRLYDGETDGYGLVTGFNQVAPAPVPEPATILLFVTGLAGLLGYRKRKITK